MNLNDAPDKTDVLIVDDSLYERNRSKKVELLSRKHDHNRKVGVLGFEMLTIGWSDGRSFLPLLFSLLSSQLAKHRLCAANESIDRRTAAGKLRVEAVSGKPKVLLSLLATLKSAGVKTRHLLFDSWFSSRKLLEELRACLKTLVCGGILMVKAYTDERDSMCVRHTTDASDKATLIVFPRPLGWV